MKTKHAEPYIWLQENEDEGIADCGCKLVASVKDHEGQGAAFYECPLHAAARKLLAACKELQEVGQAIREGRRDGYQIEQPMNRAAKAIAEAEAVPRKDSPGGCGT